MSAVVWLLLPALVVAIVVAMGLWRLSRLPAGPTFAAHGGAFNEMAAEWLGPSSLEGELRLGNGDQFDIEPPVSAELTSTPSPLAGSPELGSGARRTELADAAVIAAPAGVVAGLAVADVVKETRVLDESVLNALTQLSGQQVDGLADFLTLQSVKDYQLDSIKLRGTIGEHQAAHSFEQAGHDVTWPEGGVTEFGPSNNPGWDFQIDGHEINVKVTQDAANAAASHFANYPSVPMVVNADADNIPADAVYFDREVGLDLSSLVGNNRVIVNESLTSSGIEASQADLAEVDGTADSEAAGDAIPGLSVAVAAVQSGLREARLVQEGKTSTERALKNVGTDTALKGGGGAAGAWAGFKAGMLIDLATSGATLGIPTLAGTVGGALGLGYLGGHAATNVRLQPLQSAQGSLRAQREAFDQDAKDAQQKARQKVQTAIEDRQSELAETAAAAREAYGEMLDVTRPGESGDLGCWITLPSAGDVCERSEASRRSRG